MHRDEVYFDKSFYVHYYKIYIIKQLTILLILFLKSLCNQKNTMKELDLYNICTVHINNGKSRKISCLTFHSLFKFTHVLFYFVFKVNEQVKKLKHYFLGIPQLYIGLVIYKQTFIYFILINFFLLQG